jgi:diaminopimelate decarboxylase
MASNYNTRPFAPEILVDGNQSFVIRERQRLTDLWMDEKIPDLLRN